MALVLPPHIETIVQAYAEAVERVYLKCERAINESRNGLYSTDKWVSDSIALYADAASMWSMPWPAIKPIVMLQIDQTVTDVSAVIPLADPGFALAVTDLDHSMGKGSGSIPSAKVQATLDASRRHLIVNLRGLTQPLPVGLYQGHVYKYGEIGTKVADIEVRVA